MLPDQGAEYITGLPPKPPTISPLSRLLAVKRVRHTASQTKFIPLIYNQVLLTPNFRHMGTDLRLLQSLRETLVKRK
jgi:hypothetical protein